ncbi:MAG: hypothetical protein J0M33_27260 [Anaerolineae bacterium]|nr:hypothetical protein [Anaerolineae bacterium]
MRAFKLPIIFIWVVALTSLALSQDVSEPRLIVCGDTFEDVLITEKDKLEYQIMLSPGDGLSITSSRFGQHLLLATYVYDPLGNLLLSSTQNGQLQSAVRVQYIAAAHGTFKIVVTNYLLEEPSVTGGLGMFTMAVSCILRDGSSIVPESAHDPTPLPDSVHNPTPIAADNIAPDIIVMEDSILLPVDATAQGSEPIGEGEVRLFSPLRVNEDDLVLVRLELEALNPGPVATAPPISLPTRVPTPSLLDQQNISLYTVMAAGLEGLDIDQFQIEPEPNIQMLRLSTKEVNYWEWRLRALPGSGGDYRYLNVFLYVPWLLNDGTVGKIIIYNADIEIYVRQAETSSETAEMQADDTSGIAAEAQAANAAAVAVSIADGDAANNAESNLTDFSVIYSDPDSLTLVYYTSLNIETLKLRSVINEGWATDFAVMQLQENLAESGMCLRYVRYQSSPPLPADCKPQSTFEREVTNADVFWYDFRENRLLDTAIYFQEKLLTVCSSIAVRCDLRIET